ncbi:MAG: WXG100 family type VII secretion target [Atopobiaceae bacterium]|nr:WXG100 family type VII secretion target [Atopobiaceae bacterium]
MAGSDTVIVDFNALDSAINEFHNIGSQISSLGSELQSNSAQLQGAWKADASNTYADKIAKLVANFSKASENLEAEVTELQRLCELEKEAERAAKGIASAISDVSLH